MAHSFQTNLPVRILLLAFWGMVISSPATGQFHQLSGARQVKEELVRNIPDTRRLELMYDLSYYYIAKQGENMIDLDSGLDVLRLAEPIMLKLNDPASSGKFYLLQSKDLREKGQPEKGRSNLDKALKIFHDNHLAKVLGRKITYIPVDIPTFEPILRTAMKANDYFTQHILAVAYVEEITGQKPMSMMDFILKNKAALV